MGISLLATGCAGEACNCPAGGLAAPMCEVCSTAHPGHPGHPYASPEAVSCNHQGRHQFSALAVQVVPARARASQRGFARGRPLRSRRCPRSSFRWCGAMHGPVEVRIDGEIDDLQVTWRPALPAHRRSPSHPRRGQRAASAAAPSPNGLLLSDARVGAARSLS